MATLTWIKDRAKYLIAGLVIVLLLLSLFARKRGGASAEEVKQVIEKGKALAKVKSEIVEQAADQRAAAEQAQDAARQAEQAGQQSAARIEELPADEVEDEWNRQADAYNDRNKEH